MVREIGSREKHQETVAIAQARHSEVMNPGQRGQSEAGEWKPEVAPTGVVTGWLWDASWWGDSGNGVSFHSAGQGLSHPGEGWPSTDQREWTPSKGHSCARWLSYPLLCNKLPPNLLSWNIYLFSPYAVLCLVAQLCLTLWPRGLKPSRLLCPWRFSRQEYWSRSHAFLQGISPTQGLNPGLPHCRWILGSMYTRQVGSLGTIRGYPVLFALWERYPVMLVLDFSRKVEESKFYMKSSHFKILVFNLKKFF